MTFICSKTDDISLMEAQESLGLDEEMGDYWLEKEEFSKKVESLTTELDQLKESRVVYGEMFNDADEQIEVWETLRSSIEDGKVCFAPRARASKTKRKRNTEHRARKRQRRSGEEDSFDENSEDSEMSEEEAADSPEEEETREPLTEEQVNAKLVELREMKREARRQRAELSDKMALIRKEINEATIGEKEIEAKMSALCISGRNEYSKGAIQQVSEKRPLPSQPFSTMFPITAHVLIKSCRILPPGSKNWTKKWPPKKTKRTSIRRVRFGITMKSRAVSPCFVCRLVDIKSFKGGYAKIPPSQGSRESKKRKSLNSKLIASNLLAKEELQTANDSSTISANCSIHWRCGRPTTVPV